MSNVVILDGAAAEKYLKATGAGSNVDPFVPEHTVSGTVTVADGGGSLTVDGPLTDTQLRATAVPVSDGGGSLTVDDGGGSLTIDIPSAAWTDFYAAYGSGDGTGDKTVIAAPSAGNAIQLLSIFVIAGETAANNVLIKKASTTYAAVPMASQMDGLVRTYQYPDYDTLPAATALVVNNSAAKIFYVYGKYRVVAV